MLARKKFNQADKYLEEDRNFNLTLGDCCWLIRRREGMSLRRAASEMGMSHVTLIAAERNIKKIALVRVWNYWKSRGWTEPWSLGEKNEQTAQEVRKRSNQIPSVDRGHS